MAPTGHGCSHTAMNTMLAEYRSSSDDLRHILELSPISRTAASKPSEKTQLSRTVAQRPSFRSSSSHEASKRSCSMMARRRAVCRNARKL